MTMSIGEKSILRITSDYGYGSRGAGGVIPPNADLNFEVELLEINGKKILWPVKSMNRKEDVRICSNRIVSVSGHRP
jgi:hypothetical protein